MTDNLDETVYVTLRSAVYHTNPECQGLNSAQNVQEKPLRVIDDDLPICKLCSNEYNPPSISDSHEMRKRLEELEPDDVG